MNRTLLAGLMIVSGLALLAVMTLLIIGRDVDEVGAWASIIGVIGLPLTVLGIWLSWRQRREERGNGDVERSANSSDDGAALVTPTGGEASNRQVNRAAGRGNVFAVQGGEQHVSFVDDPSRSADDAAR